MSFERSILVPLDRIGVLVGRNGAVKDQIEKRCNVTLKIDSATGEVTISSKGDLSKTELFKAVNVVMAIARGFSPQRAFRLLNEDTVLDIVDLRDYAGKSQTALTRLKGRIIGLGGKSRKLIEELTGTQISIFGYTVAIVGSVNEVKKAVEAVGMLASGSPHKIVYNKLQRERTKAKLDRMKLWEERAVV